MTAPPAASILTQRRGPKPSRPCRQACRRCRNSAGLRRWRRQSSCLRMGAEKGQVRSWLGWQLKEPARFQKADRWTMQGQYAGIACKPPPWQYSRCACRGLTDCGRDQVAHNPAPHSDVGALVHCHWHYKPAVKDGGSVSDAAMFYGDRPHRQASPPPSPRPTCH